MFGFQYDLPQTTRQPGKPSYAALDEFGRVIAAPGGASEDHIGKSSGWAFDVKVVPVVTAGAYSAGDIMGGLIRFPDAARVIDEPVIVTGIQLSFKSDVKPSPLILLFDEDPTSTTKTNNDPYILNVADAFKVRASLPALTIGGYNTDHGTPNTINIPNLMIVMSPEPGTRDLLMLVVDLTGVTLGSVSDLQARITGVGA